MMANKRNSTIQSDPTEVYGVIVNKAVENLREDSTKQAQSEANESDRRQKIATAAYYRAARRGFGGGYEMQDWLEAEMEINDTSQSRGGVVY